MIDEERAHRGAHFQELESLKINMDRITSLLEQTLKNIFGKGLSNRLVTFAKTQAIIQPEKRMGGQNQEP